MELTTSASKQSWGSINSVNSLMRWGQGWRICCTLWNSWQSAPTNTKYMLINTGSSTWVVKYVLLPLYTQDDTCTCIEERYKGQLKYLYHYVQISCTTGVPTLLGFHLCLLASNKVFRNFSYVPCLESSRVACNKEHTVPVPIHLYTNI